MLPEKCTGIYAAPMEGITDAVYRRVHHECFPGITAYYMPFISPTQNAELSGREKRNVLPEYNHGVPCIPQILTKNADHFITTANMLADMGYTEVDLNTGCPSGTVTAKGKGAGMLLDPDSLRSFLDTVCKESPIPISVKTRLGFDSVEEWDRLFLLYKQFPLKRLIIHARISRDGYKAGTISETHRVLNNAGFSGEIVYNGDLYRTEDILNVLSANNNCIGIMLGRGLIADPALAREITGGKPLCREDLVLFHNKLADAYQSFYHSDAAMIKLRTVMMYMACCFENTGKITKQIKKAKKFSDMLDIDRRMLEECRFSSDPAFDPERV